MGFVPPPPPMRPKLGRLPFGKHRSELITDVAITDPSYLHWLLDQPWLQKSHLRILICKALDIDEAQLPLQIPPSAPTALRGYGRRIERDTEQETKE